MTMDPARPSGDENPAETRKRREESLREEKRYVTARTSEMCRYIGFGLLAVYYTTWLARGEHPPLDSRALFVVGLAGALTIAFDYLQFLCGTNAVEKALKSEHRQYDDDWCSYKARRYFFLAKQWTAGVGAAVLIIAIILSAPLSNG